MAVNIPGPWEVVIYYTFSGLTHKQRLNCDLVTVGNIGDSFNDFTVLLRDTTDIDLDVAVQAWVDLIRARYNSNTTFQFAELYQVDQGTLERTYYSTYGLSDVGTGIGNDAPARQEAYTFRTQEGGLMRVVLVEAESPGEAIVAYPTGVTSINDIFSFLVGSTNWILARDSSYPIAARNFCPTQNEVVYRKRYRA